MSLNRETASAVIPRAAALAVGITLAVMPSAQSAAIMPATELRPMQRPVEVRTPGRRR